MNTASKLAHIAKANQPKQVKNPYNNFDKKVKWGSHQYVRYVIKYCKELALQGFGSVKITIDRTTDLFQTDESRNSCYNSQFVVTLLMQEGFIFKSSYTDGNYYIDHYDAFSDVLVWDKDLPQAPSNEEIGMSWK